MLQGVGLVLAEEAGSCRWRVCGNLITMHCVVVALSYRALFCVRVLSGGWVQSRNFSNAWEFVDGVRDPGRSYRILWGFLGRLKSKVLQETVGYSWWVAIE